MTDCLNTMTASNSPTEAHSTVGTRIHVIGNSASGKSTLGARLAQALDAAFVELDALNWWAQFMIWRKHDSLLGWIITQHARKRSAR